MGKNYAIMQLCNYAIMQLCDYAIMQLCNYAIMRLCNRAIIRIKWFAKLEGPLFERFKVFNKTACAVDYMLCPAPSVNSCFLTNIRLVLSYIVHIFNLSC